MAYLAAVVAMFLAIAVVLFLWQTTNPPSRRRHRNL
jgi:hypothetical protein